MASVVAKAFAAGAILLALNIEFGAGSIRLPEAGVRFTMAPAPKVTATKVADNR
jgi:hypothetical protein